MRERFEMYRAKIGVINSYLLIGLIFTLPLAYGISNAIMTLILVLWLLEGDLLEKIKFGLQNKIMVAILAYIAITALGMLWSEEYTWGWHSVVKTLKLLMIFVFFTVVRSEHIKYYIGAFLLAMSVAELSSYGIFFEIIAPFGHATLADPAPFMGHGFYNPFLAFAIYILIDKIFYGDESYFMKLVFTFFVITMTINMFITGGRGGQLVLFVMFYLLFLRYFQAYMFRAFIGSTLLIVLLGFVAYEKSGIFQIRMNDTKIGVEKLLNSEKFEGGSTQVRLAWLLNSIGGIKSNPLFGVGTGDVELEASKTIKNYSDNFVATHNPHSMWLMVGMQTGLVGLAIFLSIFYYMFRYAKASEDRLTNLRYGFFTLFFVIDLYGSYIQAGESKSLFVVFVAILFYQFGRGKAYQYKEVQK